MGKIMGKILLAKFRHPVIKSPQTGPRIFVDAKDKDLPFDGQCKHATPSVFDHPLGLKQEGALLMAILTGVQGSSLEKVTKGTFEQNLLFEKVGDVASIDPSIISPDEKKEKKFNKVDAIKQMLLGGVLGPSHKRRGRVSPHQPHTVREVHVAVVDAAVDTSDLEELTGDENGQEDGELLQTAIDEDLDQKRAAFEASLGDVSTIPLDEYLKLVKKSTGRIGYRTQLLDELALGEDIDMWVKDSELPSIPPPEIPKETKAGDSEKSKESKPGDPGAKPVPEYKGAMRATSLVVKKARRLVGLMHTEQQNHNLKDICDWLQHLGSVAICHAAKIDDSATSQLQGGIGGGVVMSTQDAQKGDWRLPTSPALALLMAQDDLRQRLAQLYNEKALMETRRDQFDAAKKLVGKNLGGDGEEEGYELLGGKIADNLDDVDKLDKRYRKLNQKAKEEEELKSLKGKKGKKVAIRGKKDKSDSEDAPSEGRGKNSRKQRKKKGEDEYSEDEVFSGTSGQGSEGDDTEDERKLSKKERTGKPTSSQGGDSELEEGEGGDDRKRKKVKETKTEDPVQGQGKKEGQVGGTDVAKAQSQGGNIDNNTVPTSVAEESGASLASPDGNVANSGDLHSQDPAKLNRQDSGTQARGMQTLTQQKDFGHGIQEVEIVNEVVCKPVVPLQDKAIQTDDAALFSLMESIMEEMPNDDKPSGVEDETAELKRLRREIKKAQMQLRFWRSRNWVERHSRLSPAPAGRNVHPVIDSPSEAGFEFYFNAVRTPSNMTKPTTHPTGPTGASGRGDNWASGRGATAPLRFREPQAEPLRPPQPMNAKLMTNAPPPAFTRPPRTSRFLSDSRVQLTNYNAGIGPGKLQSGPAGDVQTELSVSGQESFSVVHSNSGYLLTTAPTNFHPNRLASKFAKSWQSSYDGIDARVKEHEWAAQPLCECQLKPRSMIKSFEITLRASAHDYNHLSPRLGPWDFWRFIVRRMSCTVVALGICGTALMAATYSLVRYIQLIARDMARQSLAFEHRSAMGTRCKCNPCQNVMRTKEVSK